MKKTTILILLLFFNSFAKVHAQQNSVAAGGDATGTNGSISFSIGQIDYIVRGGINGTSIQGLQQPFEMFPLSSDDFANISLKAVVYPNPMVSNIIISVADLNLDGLSYQLHDMQGKSIKEGKITTSETLLEMQQCASSTYILQLLSNHKEIKSFKIIKN